MVAVELSSYGRVCLEKIVPGRCSDFKGVISEHLLWTVFMSIYCVNAIEHHL